MQCGVHKAICLFTGLLLKNQITGNMNHYACKKVALITVHSEAIYGHSIIKHQMKVVETQLSGTTVPPLRVLATAAAVGRTKCQ